MIYLTIPPFSSFSANLAPFVKMLIRGWLVLSVGAAQTLLVLSAQAEPAEGVKSSQERSPSFSRREFDFRATPDPRSDLPRPILGKYLVFVNQDSPLMLQVVQQIEPKAFIRQYQEGSVIQAGIFQDKDNAKQVTEKLESRGIAARIVKLDKSKFYFVVVPGKREDLPRIEDQVTRLGINDQAIVSRKNKSYGSHLRIGPFAEQGQAESWNRHLLDSGLNNTRVYYGR